MQYFVDFDANGNLIGFYNSEINENIPQSAVPITPDEWQTYSADAEKYKRDGDTIRTKTQAELDAEWAARPKPPQPIDARMKAVEDWILDKMMGGV